eukprot:maker-scaffold_33-snap-gene-3.76-mRNA-1 protein AED:0.02 eAED:0.02 QI:78/1/1/1/0.75/0.6/5/507/355
MYNLNETKYFSSIDPKDEATRMEKVIQSEVDTKFMERTTDLIKDLDKIEFPEKLKVSNETNKLQFADLLWAQYQKDDNLKNYENAFKSLFLFKKFTALNKLNTGKTLSDIDNRISSSLTSLKKELYDEVSRKYRAQTFSSRVSPYTDLAALFPETSNFKDDAQIKSSRISLSSQKTGRSIESYRSLLGRVNQEGTTSLAGGFVVSTIAGDGNCLFTAVSRGLNPKQGAFQEKEDVHKLRRVVKEALLKERKTKIEHLGLTVEELILLEDEDFETYALEMGKASGGTYAGEVEIWLLARELDIIIKVHVLNGVGIEQDYKHLVTYGENVEAVDKKVINLLWRQGANESLNHYDLLV